MRQSVFETNFNNKTRFKHLYCTCLKTNVSTKASETPMVNKIYKTFKKYCLTNSIWEISVGTQTELSGFGIQYLCLEENLVF